MHDYDACSVEECIIIIVMSVKMKMPDCNKYGHFKLSYNLINYYWNCIISFFLLNLISQIYKIIVNNIR